MLEKSDMKNERFTSYYKAQHIIPEEEWDQFMEALRRPLPTTFRIAGSREYVPFCSSVPNILTKALGLLTLSMMPSRKLMFHC
jgi:hypothetical protein